jgi:hypothetical protein
VTGIIFQYTKQQTGPIPATGKHAEILADLSQQAEVLLRFVAAERSGIYDGLGQNAWVSSDPIESAVKRLMALDADRVAVVRDGAARG